MVQGLTRREREITDIEEIIKILENPEDKMAGLSIFMKSQTGRDFQFNERMVSAVAVIKIDVSEYTAKHRPIPIQNQKQLEK